MIELNEKTKQDFLNRAWVQKLLDAGVDMSDAKYCIYRSNGTDYIDYCFPYDTIKDSQIKSISIVPTYTPSELLFKLHEWARKHAEIKQKGAILMYTGANVKWIAGEVFDTFSKCAGYQDGYYIKYLASLLIECHKKDIGMKTKDTGNISNK